MKKMMIVLVLMMMTVVAVFAKPVAFNVDLDGEKYLFLSDTENKVLDSGNMSDDEIIERLKDVDLGGVAGKNYKCIYVKIKNTLDEVDKKYPYYWLISEDKSHIIVYQGLSDGRMVMLLHEETN